MSEIQTLVSRYKWLEADQEYQATIADTEDESKRLLAVHNGEQKEIERKLASLAPESFSDACCLLGFATDLAEDGCMAVGADIDMLRNVRIGFNHARQDDMKAARKEGMEKMKSTFNVIAGYAAESIELSDKRFA